MPNSKMTFEQSLKRIEEIVSILERGESSLDESLELFEEATKLCAYCNKKLEDANNKVKSFTLIEPEKEEM